MLERWNSRLEGRSSRSRSLHRNATGGFIIALRTDPGFQYHNRDKQNLRKKARIESGEAGPSSSNTVGDATLVNFRTPEDGPGHLLQFMQDFDFQSPPPPALPQCFPSGVYDEKPNANLIEMLPSPENVINPRSKYGVWMEKYLTRLPFISSEMDENVNALTTVSSYDLLFSMSDVHFF